MKIGTGNYFRTISASEQPNWYFNQANYELFPDHSTESKRQQHKLWSACDTQPVDRGPEPVVGPELNAEQVELCTMVAGLIQEYFSSAKPSAEAIFMYLACEGIPEGKGFPWKDDSTAEDVFAQLLLLGAGAMSFICSHISRTVDVEPRFAVLKLALDCKRFGLRTMRTPTSDGAELVYCVDGVPGHHTAFDNERYIPASKGGYGIVAKGKRNE